MRLGAASAGASEDMEEQMGVRRNWIAFQIGGRRAGPAATEQALGKPVASDLREGKATLAEIHAQEKRNPDEREADPQYSKTQLKRTSHQKDRT